MTDLNDFNTAVRLRDAISKMAANQSTKDSPADKYGFVQSVDVLSRTCQVLYPNASQPVTVNILPDNAPSALSTVGNFQPTVVRVSGAVNDPYVVEVLNNPAYINHPYIDSPFITGGDRAANLASMERYGAKYIQAIGAGMPALNYPWYMGAWSLPSTDNLGYVELVIDTSARANRIKKYTFAIGPSLAFDTSSRWNLLMPMFDSGNVSGYDFEAEILVVGPNSSAGNGAVTGFAVRIRRTATNTIIDSSSSAIPCYRMQAWIYGQRPSPSTLGGVISTTGLTQGDSSFDEYQGGYFIGGMAMNDPVLPTDVHGTISSGALTGSSFGSNVSPDSRLAERSQTLLSGGGLTTWDGNYVRWTRRFIAMGLGRSQVARVGYFDIGPCVGGINIPVYGNPTAVLVSTVANGIALGPWQTLYYELPLGRDNTFQETNLRIIDYTDTTTIHRIPAHWVFVAGYNNDTASSTIRLGTGEFLDSPRTLVPASPYQAFDAARTPVYWKIGTKVYVNGLFKVSATSTAGNTAATLPVGYRPYLRSGFACLTSGNTVMRVDVDPSGAIAPQGSITTAQYLFLDGISFIAAN